MLYIFEGNKMPENETMTKKEFEKIKIEAKNGRVVRGIQTFGNQMAHDILRVEFLVDSVNVYWMQGKNWIDRKYIQRIIM